MLRKIIIEKLFDKFNYEIELKKEGITILTGPNGYGKTTILQIINAFAVPNLAFFFRLPFVSITFIMEDDEIRLSRNDDGSLEMQSKNEKPTRINKNEVLPKEIRKLIDHSPFRQVDENQWLDRRTGTYYTAEEIIDQFLPDIQAKPYKKHMPEFVDVYLIREQRLMKKVARNKKWNEPYYYEEEKRESFSSTIEEYAKELSKNIKDILANASKIGQELDSSFPGRLFDENFEIDESNFNKRYDVIRDKQKSLSLYGLSVIKEERHTTFKSANAKALLVYLNDTEKKLAVFDNLLQKLEIFSSLLNNKRFVFKRLEISPDFGFRFKTEDGKDLSLTKLSSGEQQEVVLLYELLFKVSYSNTLLLIDEPEISLHVAWQKEFIDDLFKIANLQKITVIIATHSPQIINQHRDLEIDLQEILK
ncbi:MAG TPA: AAA family ATPase [Acidobacteriota bacterium]|nr:AAA family ATPase [Acidobacteriota bacterium]HQO19506.1 AAA family ATPase [Acidobacteriota bacterium]HQQ45965.1 AAA family ATPase [Acidobacteriota bacterium]